MHRGVLSYESFLQALQDLEGHLLPSLDLSGCRELKGPGLEHFRFMPLVSVDLSFCWQLVSIKPLVGRPLTNLKMSGCSKVESLLPLVGMPLTKLDLSFCRQFGDSDIETALQNMSLVDLSLWGWEELTGEGLKFLAGMPLSALNLSECDKLVDEDLACLEGVPLERLALEGCGELHGSGLRYFRNAPLSDLDISDSNIEDFYFIESEVWRCPIKHLRVSCCPYFGLEGASNVHGLSTLDWSNNGKWEADEQLQFLRGTQISFLNFSENPSLTDVGLECLRGTPIVTLHLPGCSSITSASLGLLESLSNLDFLSVDNNEMWRNIAEELKKHSPEVSVTFINHFATGWEPFAR